MGPDLLPDDSEREREREREGVFCKITNVEVFFAKLLSQPSTQIWGTSSVADELHQLSSNIHISRVCVHIWVL